MLLVGHKLGKSLAEVGRMDQEELGLWAAWFGEYDWRDDHRAGMICSVTANYAAGKWEKNPEDFFPSLKPAATEERPQTDEEIKQAAMLWCVAMGGEIVTAEKKA